MPAISITTDRPLTEAELEAIKAASQSEDIAGILERNRPADLTEPLTIAGAGYEFAGAILPPVSLGTIYALAMAGSPFVNDAPEATPTDIMVAAYIVANGQAAIQPLAGLQWRLRAFRQAEKIAAKSPELFAIYLDKLTAVSGSGAELDRAAFIWWESLPEAISLHDAGEIIETAIVDAYGWADMFSSKSSKSDEAGNKTPAWSPESLGVMLSVAAGELNINDDRALWMPLASLGYQIASRRARTDESIGREPDWGEYIRAIKQAAGIDHLTHKKAEKDDGKK